MCMEQWNRILSILNLIRSEMTRDSQTDNLVSSKHNNNVNDP